MPLVSIAAGWSSNDSDDSYDEIIAIIIIIIIIIIISISISGSSSSSKVNDIFIPGSRALAMYSLLMSTATTGHLTAIVLF